MTVNLMKEDHGSVPEKFEIGRVAFRREESTNPETGFVSQLQEVIIRADECALVLNEWDDERERLVEESLKEYKKQVQDILGKPSKDLQ